MRIAGDNNHPPYEFIDENGIYKGFNVDIVNALSLELGIDIELFPMEWNKAIKALENKEVDAIQGMSKTEEREKKFLFTEPTVKNSQAIFVKKETNIVAGLDDLSGLKVAIQEGDINHELIKGIPNVTIIAKSNQKQAVECLLNGKADAYVGNRLTGLYYLQKLRKTHLVKIVGETMGVVEYGPATYLGNEEVLNILEDGIKELKKNGTYDKIFKKWFGEDLLKDEAFFIAQRKEVLMIAGIIVLIILFLAILFAALNKKLKKEVNKRTEELREANKVLISHQRKIHNLAYFDSVTSLPNRLYLMEALERNIQKASIGNEKLALIYFDLDRFKHINDNLGHDIGDKVLKQVGNRIKKLIDESYTFGRVGGDEFLIIMKNISNEDKVITLANKIINDFNNPFIISDYKLFLTTSIGVAIYPDAGTTIKTLLKNADLAMYKAKNDGGNNYYVYTRELSEKEKDNLIIINDLRQAIKSNQFKLFYQPIIDICTNNIIGMEALIRWDKPGEGIISPARFISIAEETGLIIPIGEWVIRTACMQNRQWIEKGYKPIKVSINISAKQFQQTSFAETVLRIIEETGVDPKNLVFEITESTAVIDVEYTLEMLNKLKDLGINISIDDFGTGYSSLNKLKEMNIDELKIDRSFIKDINRDIKNEKIAKTIIFLAQELGIKVTAEGVETKEQLEFLLKNGCDKAQGFFYGKPVSADEFEKFLENK